jgi:SAM-dependent methyltransferase
MTNGEKEAMQVGTSSSISVQRDPRVSPPVGVVCPLCGGPSRRTGDAPGWGEWRCCSECTLEFVHPLRLGDDPKALFDAAYRGRVQQSGMSDFGKRTQQRRAIVKEPALWFWTPAFQEVTNWLRQRLGTGSTVLELGCGLGFYLHALRREGFRPVGLDVAEVAVDLNRKDGFEVWHGSLDSMPETWVRPDAVVAFFMLHHLQDPARFVSSIRERWPNAPLAVAQYGPTNKDPIRSSPPRTLTRWSARALARALERSGYTATVQEIPSTGVESGLVGPVRAIFKRLLPLPWAYRLSKRMAVRLLPKVLTPLQREAYVLLAFGEPTGTQRR